MNAWPKRCGCGQTHTPEQWACLQLVGNVGDAVETLEMRNCGCGSTLAIVVAGGES